MKTVEKKEVNQIADSDTHAYILRMERNNRELSQLKNKLASYTCEPQTHGLYERIELLKSCLESLLNKNKEIMVSLKKSGPGVESQWNGVKQQIAEFKEIKQSVQDYMGGLSNYR